MTMLLRSACKGGKCIYESRRCLRPTTISKCSPIKVKRVRQVTKCNNDRVPVTATDLSEVYWAKHSGMDIDTFRFVYKLINDDSQPSPRTA